MMPCAKNGGRSASGPDGWEAYTVYPLRKCYKIQSSSDSPPDHNETWEYDVKGSSRGPSQVFHRLIDANEEWFDDPVFEVINGTISEEGVAENSSDDYF